ncbi:MAG TPA: PQQ-binding-like beta-propeller repeat protein [Armatimonadota bacterium]
MMRSTLFVSAALLIAGLLIAADPGPVAAQPGATAAPATTPWTYLVNAEHSGNVPGNLTLPLVLRWRYDPGAPIDAVATPAVEGDRVYFISGRKPAATPTQPAAGGMPVPLAPGEMPQPGQPGMGGGFGGGFGGNFGPEISPDKSVLYAVSRSTGALLWTLDTDVEVTSGLTTSQGTVFFGAADGKLWAVDGTTGDKKWRFEATSAIRSAPLLEGGVMYFGADDNRIYAYDLKNNELLWQFETGAPIQTTPVIYRDFLLVASQDGYLYALRRDSGAQVWRQPLGTNQSFSSPMVLRDKIIVAAGQNLLAVDARYGERRWTFTTGDLIVGTPAAAGRTIFVGSADGVLYAINDLTGKGIWRYPADSAGPEISSQPITIGNLVLVRRGERDLIALNQSNGQVRWEFALPAPPDEVAALTAAADQAGSSNYGGRGGRRGNRGFGGGFNQPGGTGAAVEGYNPTTGLPLYGWVASSGLIIQNGEAFVVGNDGALYSFRGGAADRLRPEVKSALLQIQVQGNPYAYDLRVADARNLLLAPPAKEDVLQTNGAPPLYLQADVSDLGSGINPAAVQVLLDGKPVPEEQQYFEPDRSLLWWLYEPQGVAANNLPNGLHKLTLRVQDWSANVSESLVYFQVDNSLNAPVVPGQDQTGFGGMGGFGGFGGNGGPGGMPGGMPGGPGAPPPPPPPGTYFGGPPG